MDADGTERHTLAGRQVGTGQPVRLTWSGDRFESVLPASPAEAGDRWLAPALFDPQVNGFAGVDFQSDDLTPADLRRAVAGLGRAGCTRFFLTLITDAWDRLLNRLTRLRALRSADPGLSNAIAGWHIEGPFLSAEPGFHGAHDPACMEDPAPEQIRVLRDLTGRDPVLLTLAPERRGAIEAIRMAVKLGMTISLGHTDAPAATLAEAVAAGATGFTHLANGCPQSLDRHDNILWRVLDTPGLRVSLIPDGRHVAPPLFRLIHRVLPPANLLYTTDAMAAAGAPPGRYRLGRLELEVGEDQVVRQPGRTNFAGSALVPVAGVFRAAAMLGISWRQCWAGFSAVPASWLGVPAGLAAGNRADCCALEFDSKGRLERLHTVSAGRFLETAGPDALPLRA